MLLFTTYSLLTTVRRGTCVLRTAYVPLNARRSRCSSSPTTGIACTARRARDGWGASLSDRRRSRGRIWRSPCTRRCPRPPPRHPSGSRLCSRRDGARVRCLQFSSRAASLSMPLSPVLVHRTRLWPGETVTPQSSVACRGVRVAWQRCMCPWPGAHAACGVTFLPLRRVTRKANKTRGFV